MNSRFDFVKYTPEAMSANEALTNAAIFLEGEIEKLPNSREKALAFTKLEESVMWARKSLRDVGGPRETEPVNRA